MMLVVMTCAHVHRAAKAQARVRQNGEPERGYLENLALQMLADQTLLRCIPLVHEEENGREVGREVVSTAEHTTTLVDPGIVVRTDPISS